jgi:hypothetical protein
MPTLNIGGHRVKVGDEFLSMTPDEQSAAVDEIARSLPSSTELLGTTPAQGDQPAKVVIGTNPQPDVGTATSIGRGAAQGLTLGGYDELRGLSEAGGVKPDEPMTLGSLLKGGFNLLTGSGDEGYKAGSERALAELKTAQEQHPAATMGGEVGGALGSALALAPLSIAGNAARAGMGLSRVAMGSAADGAFLGGAQGALSAEPGDRLQGFGTGTLTGAGIGGVAPLAISGVTNAFRRAVTPLPVNAERQAAANVLRNEGVDLSAGQLSGSKGLRYAESEIGGNASENLMERQGEQFTNAALRRAGENAPRATPEVIDRAFNRIGQQFDGLAARNQIVPDQQLANDLQGAVTEYTSLVPEAMRAPVVHNVAQDIVDAMNRGPISGDAYQALRSRLDRAARTSRADPQLSDALRGLRESLDDAMQRSIAQNNPRDLGGWQQARRQYRNMLVVEKAATGAGENAALGLISPSQLRNATVQQGRRAYARGQGDFAELARAGEALMKPMPQSGTAPRLAARNLGTMIPAILGGGAGAGVGGPFGAMAGAAAGAAAPRIFGSLMMSPMGQRYLSNQLLAGPASLRARALAGLLSTNASLAAQN